VREPATYQQRWLLADVFLMECSKCLALLMSDSLAAHDEWHLLYDAVEVREETPREFEVGR
jgi:hypothetical protein